LHVKLDPKILIKKNTATKEVGKDAIAADAAMKWSGNLSFLFYLN
jgi:hypothetical protein